MSAVIFSLLDTSAVGGAEEYLLSYLFFEAQRGESVILATSCQAVKDRIANDKTNPKQNLKVIDLPFRLDAIGDWKGLVKFFLVSPLAIYWLYQVKTRYFKQATVRCLLPGFSDRLFFSPWLKRWGYHLLWLEYGPLEPTFARNFGIPRLLYRLTQHLPERVVTISRWTQQSLVTTGQIPKAKIVIAYPGVNPATTAELAQLRAAGQEWRAKHQLTNQPLVVAVGRLATEKEFEVLIKAVANWPPADGQPPHLVLIGDGPEKSHLQQLAVQQGLKNRLTFTGYVAEATKKALLATSDVFVFPSAWPLEGFGMTTIEAMNMGVPVITTGFGPQAEIIRDGQNGLYFSAHDSHDLTQKIQLLLKNKKLATKLATQARQTLQAHFTAKQMHQTLAASLDLNA